MSSKAANFFDRLISLCIYGAVALIPVFFLPFTPDAVEFNKQFLLYFLVTIGLISWVLRGIIDKKLLVRRTPLDIPLLLIVFTMLAAAILSKNRYLSFWGDFSSLGNSFVSFIFYILFYFLILNNIHSVKQIGRLMMALVISAVASSAYFIVQALNIFPAIVNWPIPRWSVASDLPTHFGYFLTIAMVALFSLMMAKKQSFWRKGNIFGTLGLLIILAVFVLLGFKSVWVVVAVAMFALLVFSISRIEEIHVPWVSVCFGIMILSLLFILLGTPKFLTANLPTEVALSPGVSWKIATSSLTEDLRRFLFGSGPSTFVYDFSAYRPDIFNSNFAWSLRFSKPYDSALDILSTTGILGVIAWVSFFLVALGMLFVMWFIRSVRSKKKSIERISDLMHLSDEKGDIYAHTLFAGLLTGWLTLFFSMFLIIFSTVHWVLFFGFLAMAFLIGSDFTKREGASFELSLKTMPQYTLISSFIYILIFAVISILIIFLGRFYAGEVYKAQALKYSTVGNNAKAASAMFSAVSLNPNYSKYYLDLASAYIGMATIESQKAGADQQTIANLVASAVNQARQATQLAPNDAAAWDFLSSMYVTARPLSQNANSFVISALEKAISLEKTNPRLYLELGKAKILQRDFSGGRDALEKAIALKQDYVLGYSTLSQLDELESKVNESIEHMSVAAALSPNDPSLLFNLGRLYYNRAKQDDLARAEQLYIMALQINSNYSDALWSLGVLYERKGRQSDALQLYKRVLELNPDTVEVKKKVNALGG